MMEITPKRLLARIIHEASAEAADMHVSLGLFEEPRPRRTVQVRRRSRTLEEPQPDGIFTTSARTLMNNPG